MPRQRSILGLRRRPGRIALAFMRLPLRAYAHGAGWLLGTTFVKFTHVGRRSRAPHEAVAMVLRHEPATDEVVICAGWADTDWYRNLKVAPAASVELGRLSFVPEQRFLDDAEAVEVVRLFVRNHPYRAALISRILGWGDLRNDAIVRRFVDGHPFVAFRPAPAAARDERGAFAPRP